MAAESEVCRILGRGEDELRRSPVEAALHPDDASAERARHEQLLSGTLQAYRAELRWVRAGGDEAWALVEGRSVAGAGGAPAAVVLLVADVSGRRRLEAGVVVWTQTDAELDHAGALVSLKDAAGRFVAVNAAYEDRFRVSGAVLRGRDDAYLFPLATATALEAHDALARDSAGLVEGRDVVPLADGDHEFIAFRFALGGPAGKAAGPGRRGRRLSGGARSPTVHPERGRSRGRAGGGARGGGHAGAGPGAGAADARRVPRVGRRGVLPARARRPALPRLLAGAGPR